MSDDAASRRRDQIVMVMLLMSRLLVASRWYSTRVYDRVGRVRVGRRGQGTMLKVHGRRIESERQERATRNVRVLVVDCLADSRDMTADLLRAYGYTVETCTSDDRVFAQAGRFRPDVVLVEWVRDRYTPDEEFAESLRKRITSRKESRPILVVVSTTLDRRGVGPRLAFDGYLQKPVMPDALLAELDQHLNN